MLLFVEVASHTSILYHLAPFQYHTPYSGREHTHVTLVEEKHLKHNNNAFGRLSLFLLLLLFPLNKLVTRMDIYRTHTTSLIHCFHEVPHVPSKCMRCPSRLMDAHCAIASKQLIYSTSYCYTSKEAKCPGCYAHMHAHLESS